MPYSLLDERTKKMGWESAREAVGTLLAFGYSLEPLNQEPSMSQSHIINLINAT